MTVAIDKPFAQGEIPAPLIYTYQDNNGVVLNLTGFTTVRFVIARYDGNPIVRSDGASLVNGPQGQVQYIWTAADVAIPGFYEGQFWVSNASNKYASEIIEFVVEPSAGHLTPV